MTWSWSQHNGQTKRDKGKTTIYNANT